MKEGKNLGTFINTKTPAPLMLLEWEETERKANIAATGSPSPVPYRPIALVPTVYTHVGHDAQYGAGRRNGRTVRLIILHTTEADTFVGSMSYGARRPEQVSATCYSGKDGELGYGVAEENRPYTTQRWNDESVSVEICGKAVYTAAEWRARPKQMESLVKLVVDWCKRFAIPPTWLGPAQVAQGASPLGAPPVQGVNRGITDHWDANVAARLLGATAASTSHNDVGPGLREVFFVDLLPEIIRRLNPQPQPTPIPTPTPTPEPIPHPPSNEEEAAVPFIIKKANGETALIYGSGKMVGLAGPDIQRYEAKFGPALLTDDVVYGQFANKSS